MCSHIIFVHVDVPKIFNHINTVLEQLTLSTVEASIMSTTTGVVRRRFTLYLLSCFFFNETVYFFFR
jgi:hypothetical protein